MKYLTLLLLFLPTTAHAQLYGAPGGLYPICQPVTACISGQCQTVTVCK